MSIPVRVLISAGIVAPTVSDSPLENGLLKALQIGWSTLVLLFGSTYVRNLLSWLQGLLLAD